MLSSFDDGLSAVKWRQRRPKTDSEHFGLRCNYTQSTYYSKYDAERGQKN